MIQQNQHLLKSEMNLKNIYEIKFVNVDKITDKNLRKNHRNDLILLPNFQYGPGRN